MCVPRRMLALPPPQSFGQSVQQARALPARRSENDAAGVVSSGAAKSRLFKFESAVAVRGVARRRALLYIYFHGNIL